MSETSHSAHVAAHSAETSHSAHVATHSAHVATHAHTSAAMPTPALGVNCRRRSGQEQRHGRGEHHRYYLFG
jgi:hypothetical protein